MKLMFLKKIFRWIEKNKNSVLSQLRLDKQFSSYNSHSYNSHKRKSSRQAKNYDDYTAHNPYRYLAYRDIPFLIHEYVSGKNALDYGAGTGISSRFLIDQGFKVTGVDVSKEMLSQAVINCPTMKYYLMDKDIIPVESKTYDFIFSSFVLFEIGNRNHMLLYLREAKRVMKDNGIMIAITGSEELYSKDWLIWDTDYICNKKLKSGDKAKLFLRDANIEFTDYYWTESDYRNFFKETGFTL